jgi:RNA polymerase sporulation-specific sigma factor
MGNCNEKSEIAALIEKVRANDQAAFEQLLCKYTPLLDAAVARFTNAERTKPYVDDLRQEAILVFYNAILNYDIDNESVEFGLYAKICVTNALISQLRMLSKIKTEQLTDEVEGAELSDESEPADRLIENESLKRIDSVIRGNLSSLEYRVWCLYASGRTARDIAKLVGKSEKSVTNAIYRIRKKLRALLG